MSPAAASTTSGSPSWSLLAQRQADAPAVKYLTAASNVEPLELRLLVDDDQIDVIPATKAVIGHRQQTVRVRRQIYAAHRSLHSQDRIDEARP